MNRRNDSETSELLPTYRGLPLREALLPTPGWRQAASSSEPPEERGVGVPSSRSLATASHEALSFYGGRPGHGHIFIGDGLAAVKASGAVYAGDNGRSDSPCQIRFRLVRIARTMDGICGSHKVEEGSGR